MESQPSEKRPAPRLWGETDVPSYQEIIATDPVGPREAFRDYSNVDLPVSTIARSVYTSDEFARTEMERMWPRVWQLACREEQLPKAGDLTVYDSPNASFIIVRTESGDIRAFYNSCRHRGMKLCTRDTSVRKLTCPFHGFTWTLEGKLHHIPARWDFPEVDDAEMRLPEARVGRWAGFVFINQDEKAPPLETYLGRLVPHCVDWHYEELELKAIVRRNVKANWKVSLDSFLEVFHVPGLHPQLMAAASESSAQYDVWPDDPHVSRFLNPVGVPSAHYRSPLTEQEILNALLKANSENFVAPNLPEGIRARSYLMSMIREYEGGTHGRDFSKLPDGEVSDGIQYFVFPNMMIFRQLSLPVFYRFLPKRDDCAEHTFEVFILGVRSRNADTEVEIVDLGYDKSYSDAQHVLSYQLLEILDQDVVAIERCQKGLRDGGKGDLILSRYQEVRIRHLHQTLQSYIRGDLQA